jgi:hypothetical protein
MLAQSLGNGKKVPKAANENHRPRKPRKASKTHEPAHRKSA